MASPMFRSYERVMRKISLSNLAGRIADEPPALTDWDAPVRIGTLTSTSAAVRPETVVAAVLMRRH